MRRDKNTKEFVGSAFVEYTTQSMLRAALQHEFVSKGAALNTCALEEFLFAAKERRDAEKNSSSSGYGDAAKTNKADKRPFEAEVKVEFTKGLILKLTKHAELLDREKIREVLNAHGTVAFIDYARNQEEGFVRMEDADSAKAALSAINSTSKTEEVVAEGAEGWDNEGERTWKKPTSMQARWTCKATCCCVVVVVDVAKGARSMRGG